jgi:hypothetical protein
VVGVPHSGRDLGVDIYGLWRAGRRDLPAVADQYAAARSAVARTADGDGAFRRADRFGGGAHGPAHAPWTGLRDELEQFLKETATNLELTGEALCLAAAEYAKTDAAAAEEFGRLKRDNVETVAPGGAVPGGAGR